MSYSCEPVRSPLDYPEFHTADMVTPYLELTETQWRRRMDYMPPESQEYGLNELRLTREFLTLGRRMGTNALSATVVDNGHLQRDWTFNPIGYGRGDNLEELSIHQAYDTDATGRICSFMARLELHVTKPSGTEFTLEKSVLPMGMLVAGLAYDHSCESTEKTRSKRYELEMALRHTNPFQATIFEKLCKNQETLGGYLKLMTGHVEALARDNELHNFGRSVRFVLPDFFEPSSLN